jgi:hypothetical protein
MIPGVGEGGYDLNRGGIIVRFVGDKEVVSFSMIKQG